MFSSRELAKDKERKVKDQNQWEQNYAAHSWFLEYNSKESIQFIHKNKSSRFISYKYA